MSHAEKPANFIETIISDDLASGTTKSLVTRFPPEPNGYLHIGHAKSICLNFSLAEQFGGACNLRFDDTNPEKEEQEYVDAIQRDVQWLGFEWAGEPQYSSDYFEQLYAWAEQLIQDGNAYVCELNAEETREYRGSLKEPGKNSPYRDRSVEESLALFRAMRAGEVDEGKATLRAKIDMASPNINLRDPVLYRIKKVAHHRQGDKWCIYPSYDYAHGQGDAIEGVTHSICTLEFQDHRPLYEWFIANLPVPAKPRQYEFGRLNLSYTVTSKRKLRSLVEGGVVDGWDDPRMPTVSGMRRRGYTARSLRNFCDSLAVAKTDGVVDVAQLEFFVRDDLNQHAPRAMAVLNPLRLTVINPEAITHDTVSAPVHPNDESMGTRSLPFDTELFIDKADFTEDTSLSRKKFKRLVLGEYVRLRAAYVIKAEEVVRDDAGEITEVKVSVVADTVGETPPEGIRPRGVIHWVSATRGVTAEVRLYDRLFNEEAPDAGDKDFMDCLSEDSLTVVQAVVEPGLVNADAEVAHQFEREGYFCRDSKADTLVFNRTIGLKDTWAKKV